MNFNWKDLLGFVENLYGHANDLPCKEGVYRTIVNRAYYSALNTAAVFIREEIGEDLPEDHTYHQKVSDYFEDDEEIYQLLDELRDKRRKADYDFESREFDAMAQIAIEELREFVGFHQFTNVFGA